MFYSGKQTFWDQFSSSIDQNQNLLNTDKFNYLISLLSESAFESTKGLSLTSTNYEKAIVLLHERFGNKQILIPTNMDILVKLSKVFDIKDLKNLRKLFHSLETSVRNLTDLDIVVKTYGTLLINIIFDRIPAELKIIISREFKNDVWDLRKIIEIFKNELFALERISAISDNEKTEAGNLQDIRFSLIHLPLKPFRIKSAWIIKNLVFFVLIKSIFLVSVKRFLMS